MKKDKKILEIRAKGGSITIYRYDESEHHDWYYHRVSEMSYEDLDMPGVDKKSRYCMSIGEALIRMQSEYKDVYSLYPLYVDPAYKDIVILMLKSYQEEFDRNINFEQWAKVLGVEEDDIRVNFKYNESDFEYLTKKYGKYASWAIWNSEDEKDTKVIFTNKSLLNTKYVGVGLNISNPVKTWGNFRGGKHDRKLKQAFNECTIRGFYLTDIIKGVKE